MRFNPATGLYTWWHGILAILEVEGLLKFLLRKVEHEFLEPNRVYDVAVAIIDFDVSTEIIAKSCEERLREFLLGVLAFVEYLGRKISRYFLECAQSLPS